MKKSIYNVYVVMDSQETCDRMKQLCIDNGLKTFNVGFEYRTDKKYFRFTKMGNDFYISKWTHKFTQVTEQEFIELLKTTKDA